MIKKSKVKETCSRGPGELSSSRLPAERVEKRLHGRLMVSVTMIKDKGLAFAQEASVIQFLVGERKDL